MVLLMAPHSVVSKEVMRVGLKADLKAGSMVLLRAPHLAVSKEGLLVC